MTVEEYLQAIIAKNPALGKPDDEKVTLTCRGLRALIRQAYEKGFEQHKLLSEKVDGFFGKGSSNPFGGSWPF